ncbi:MAG: hypothetical protein LUE24_07000 [Lachnospiraceae bacterium]|nr:hypothetical protein [Lachnospiraceae bacterium]
MKRYLIADDYSEVTLRRIHEKFLSEFHVDLDDNKYLRLKPEEIIKTWQSIAKDCFGDEKIKIRTCWDLINGFTGFFESRKMYKSRAEGTNWKEIERQRRDMISWYEELPQKYYLYNADVWLDAIFAIKYAKCGVKSVDYLKNRSSQDYMQEEGYALPFSDDDLQSAFCDPIKTALLNSHKRNIFQIQAYESKAEKTLEWASTVTGGMALHIKYSGDCDFTRWSYQKMKDVEKNKNFGLEDRILFHKVFGDILARNAAYEIDKNGGELSDFRIALYHIGHMNLFLWGNIMALLYIKVNTLADNLELEMEDIQNIRHLFYSWLSQTERIMERERLLAQGLFYVYWNRNYENNPLGNDVMNVMEVHASNLLDEVTESDDDIDAHMKRDSKERRVKEFRTGKSNNGIGWKYAFLQMEFLAGRDVGDEYFSELM